MNIRFATAEIRFRLSEQEALKLQAKNTFHQSFTLSPACEIKAQLQTHTGLTQPLQLCSETTTIALNIDSTALDNLIKNPSKSGIQLKTNDQSLNVIFQIYLDKKISCS